MEETKRSTHHNLVLQGAILAAAALIARVFGFIYKIPLVNILTDEGSGYYAISSSIYAFFLMISTFGFPVAISKLMAERWAEKKYKEAQMIFRSSFYLSFIIGVFFSAIMWFAAEPLAALMGSPKNVPSIQALAPALLVFSLLAVFRGYFQGMSTMMPTAISQIVEQIFNAIFSLVLAYAWLGRGIEYSAAGGSLGTGIGALSALLMLILIYYLVRKGVMTKRLRRDKHVLPKRSMFSYWKMLLVIAVPMVIGSSLTTFTAIVDIFMFQRALIFKGYEVVEATALNGIYTLKHQPLITLPVALAAAIATASIPSLATSLVQNKQDEVAEKIHMALKATMVFTVPAAVGLGVLAQPINAMLFTADSTELVGRLMQVGAISVVFFGISTVSVGILQGIGKLHVQVVTSIVGLIVKILLNLLLIVVLNLNIYGVVIANVIFALVSALMNMRAVTKYIDMVWDWNNLILIPTISALFMGVMCFIFYYVFGWITGSSNLAVLIAMALGAVVYGIALVKLKGITEEEILTYPKGYQMLKLLKRVRLI